MKLVGAILQSIGAIANIWILCGGPIGEGGDRTGALRAGTILYVVGGVVNHGRRIGDLEKKR